MAAGCVLALMLMPVRLSAVELGVNVYGFSYHLDRRDEFGRKFNERNPGVGVNASFLERHRSTYYLEAGIFEDSYNYGAKYVTVGYDYRLYKGLSIGTLIGFYDSRAVTNEGFALVAVPLLSFRYHAVKLHLVHLPEFPGINPYPSFAFYATVYVWQKRPTSR